MEPEEPEAPEEEIKAPVKKGVDTRVKEKKLKFTYKEQKEYEQLAKDIENLEIEKAEITAKMQEQLDYQEIEALGKRMNEITDLIDEKELRWLELDEI